MHEEGASNERTILDYLNWDCWRAVLSHVPARDVMRTERASRRWQAVVLSHLRDVRISIIVKKIRIRNKSNFNACTLESSKYKSFEAWTSKLGSSVVATDCGSWESLETIRVNCPNLETLTLFNLPDCTLEQFPHNLNEDFQKLKQLSFSECGVSDHCISQFLAEKALEELELNRCHEVTGQFLNTMNSSNLKSFVIERSHKLSVREVVSAVHRLSELTHLTLDYVNKDIAEQIQFVLDKMPKLEELVIVAERIACYTFVPLSRLTCLKNVNLSIQLGDDGIEAMMRSCKELRTLTIDCEGMTSSGAQALGRHGTGLASLTLIGFFELDDDGVLAIVRGCPELEWLDVSGASFLTPALPARAQAEWRASRSRPRRRLRLDLSNTNLEDYDFLDTGDLEEHRNMMGNYSNLLIVLGSEDEDK